MVAANMVVCVVVVFLESYLDDQVSLQINWGNADSSITMSHRSIRRTAMPQENKGTTSHFPSTLVFLQLVKI